MDLNDLLVHLLWMLILVPLQSVHAQQAYVDNHQLDCYNEAYNSTTLGFVCNGLQNSCQSYLTFRSTSLYNSPATIGYLLGAQQSAPLIASINNISSDVAVIPDDFQVVIPVNCSCLGRNYYQHNASYNLKDESETYFTVANNTYQGLTTCQALMAQNPYGDRNLTVGLDLLVPLRCACPTSNQTALGIKYLLVYMVTFGDTVSSIAQLFEVEEQAVLDANQLSSTDIIYPFTPILVPLTHQPTKIQHPSSPPAAPSPQTSINPTSSTTSSSKKWVFVGVGIGLAFLLLLATVAGFLFRKRRRPLSAFKPNLNNKNNNIPTSQSDSADYAAMPDTQLLSLSSHGVRYAIESLTVYKYEDLKLATENFSQAYRIRGTVYKASFKGDAAAVKVVKGDVSGEINILKKVNHSNIIRLSGFCVHEGNTYLVYEYAENGSLGDWLLHHSFYGHHYRHGEKITLTWKQRVQIGYDVADALNYLHNYTNPPHIHKNLKSSNILLDANMRAKVSNFGLARSLHENEEGDGGLQLTRHVVGTHGYMAPEYIENGIITHKLDVFAFGVVLLELLSGKEAAAGGNKNNNEELLWELIGRVIEGDNVRQKLRGFMDPSLREEYPLDVAFSMAQLARTCVARDLNARPSMPQVIMTLSKILSSSLDWDPSDELHRSTSLTHATATGG